VQYTLQFFYTNGSDLLFKNSTPLYNMGDPTPLHTSAASAPAAPAAAPVLSVNDAVDAVKGYLSTHSASGSGGEASTSRMIVYQMIQAQQPVSGGEGALYTDLKCSICTELAGSTPTPSNPDPVALSCGHIFCRFCVLESIRGNPALGCPTCRV